MFDHIQHQPKRTGPNRTVLLAATLGTVVAFGGIAYACLVVLSKLGLTNVVQPVEVTFDPYEDGTQMEDLLGEDGVPYALEELAPAVEVSPGSEGSASPPP